MRAVLMMLICVLGLGVEAEWFLVQDVLAYNKLQVVAENESVNPVQLRIRNLEKIEYIQDDPEKVLLGGESAKDLTKSLFKGQRVWVENLITEGDENVADVYPSFDRVMTAFKERRLVQGDNIKPALKERLKLIYQQMLQDMDSDVQTALADGSSAETVARNEIKKTVVRIYGDMLESLTRDSTLSSSADPDIYETEYDRARLVRSALGWYQVYGQQLPTQVQKLFIGWLKSLPSASDEEAKQLVFRITDMMRQTSAAGLFKNLFLEEDRFDRAQFVYNALLWFKEQGQFMPGNIQEMFVRWLEEYQKRLPQDSEFLKERIEQMIERNDLYQDFLY